MNIQTAIEKLDEQWEQIEPKGFFGKLRMGEFDEIGFEHVQEILNSVQIPEGEFIDRRFVEVVWFIPTFLHWQRWAWEADGKDTKALDDAIRFFEQRLTTILGLP